MMLSEKERERFAIYLQQSAESDMLIIKELKKIPGHDEKIKQMRVEAMASRIVATKLMSIETEAIG